MSEEAYHIQNGRVIHLLVDERDPAATGLLYSTAERCRSDSHRRVGDDSNRIDRIADFIPLRVLIREILGVTPSDESDKHESEPPQPRGLADAS